LSTARSIGSLSDVLSDQKISEVLHRPVELA
jgi:hypothetical protein